MDGMETYVRNGDLVREDEWSSHIDGLRKRISQPSEQRLKQAISDAIRSRLPSKRFGIFFSGGVDSTFIAFLCKQMKADFICYSVGLQGSKDLKSAQKAAKELGFDLKIAELSPEELEELMRKVVKILKVPDVIKVGVASVVWAAAELAKKDGITDFFGGLGTEEIFAGYERHANAKDVNEECWSGLKAMWQRDLTRDVAIANALKISILTPFLDENVILEAMAFEGSRKINAEQKKIILREIAESSGLPKEFAWRKKLAAQYGSKIDNVMEKLAKKRGFSFKKDYLQSLL